LERPSETFGGLSHRPGRVVSPGAPRLRQDLIVRELHTAFELGAEAVRQEDVAGDHRPVIRPTEGERV